MTTTLTRTRTIAEHRPYRLRNVRIVRPDDPTLAVIARLRPWLTVPFAPIGPDVTRIDEAPPAA
ncbi:MAG: hypothetical protein M0Z69_15325 [Actinomycetota bacterium]|nr:hypothetical protein [Actinomycetota bacterium]